MRSLAHDKNPLEQAVRFGDIGHITDAERLP